MFARLQQTFGGLDVLVNSASVSGPTKPVTEVTDEGWNQLAEMRARLAVASAR